MSDNLIEACKHLKLYLDENKYIMDLPDNSKFQFKLNVLKGYEAYYFSNPVLVEIIEEG